MWLLVHTQHYLALPMLFEWTMNVQHGMKFYRGFTLQRLCLESLVSHKKTKKVIKLCNVSYKHNNINNILFWSLDLCSACKQYSSCWRGFIESAVFFHTHCAFFLRIIFSLSCEFMAFKSIFELRLTRSFYHISSDFTTILRRIQLKYILRYVKSKCT